MKPDSSKSDLKVERTIQVTIWMFVVETKQKLWNKKYNWNFNSRLKYFFEIVDNIFKSKSIGSLN